MGVIKTFDQNGSHLEIAKELVGEELQYSIFIDGCVVGTLNTINTDAVADSKLDGYVDIQAVILEEIERSIKRIHRLGILPHR